MKIRVTTAGLLLSFSSLFISNAIAVQPIQLPEKVGSETAKNQFIPENDDAWICKNWLMELGLGYPQVENIDLAKLSPKNLKNLRTAGVIKRILNSGKIELGHGCVCHLALPPLSMIYTFSDSLKDSSLIKNLKVGQTILFLANKRNKRYYIDYLETEFTLTNAILAQPLTCSGRSI